MSEVISKHVEEANRLLREMRLNSRISDDGNKMYIKPHDLMGYIASLQECVDVIREEIALKKSNKTDKQFLDDMNTAEYERQNKERYEPLNSKKPITQEKQK